MGGGLLLNVDSGRLRLCQFEVAVYSVPVPCAWLCCSVAPFSHLSALVENVCETQDAGGISPTTQFQLNKAATIGQRLEGIDRGLF